MKTQVDIKLLNGSKQEVTYETVETVGMPLADGTGEQVFTAGEPLDDVPVALDFTEGDQRVEVPEGYVARSAVITKPEALQPENIRKNVNVGGVVGEFIGDTEERTVDLNFPSGSAEEVLGEQPFTSVLDTTYGYCYNPDGQYEMVVGENYTVMWGEDEFSCVAMDGSAVMDGAVFIGNATPFGLAGNNEPFAIGVVGGGLLIACLTDTEPTSHTVAIYHVTEGIADMVVTPSEDGKVMSKVTVIKPEGAEQAIAKGETLAGIVGEYVTPGTTKEIEPDFSDGDQSIAAEGDERWNEVLVKKPETLIPENIAKDVNVGGVVGVLEKPLCIFTLFHHSSWKVTYKNAGTLTCKPYVSIPLDSEIVLVLADSGYITQSTTTNLQYPALQSPEIVTNYTETNGSLKEIAWSYSRNFTGYGCSAAFICVVFVVPGITLKTTDDGIVFHCDATVRDIPQGNASTKGSFQSRSIIIEADLQESVITNVAQMAFYGASSLKKVSLPDTLISIGHYAFQGCSKLSELTIPNGVTSIGDYAFSSCPGLVELTIPNGVTSIGTAAFKGCSNLSELTIPNGVTSINIYTFMDCTGLKQVTLLGAVTSIGGYAFKGCTGLTEIVIPATVTSIGAQAFYNCKALATLDCSSLTSVPALGDTSVFYNCPSTLQIKVPAALYDEWIAATNWSTYADYIVAV